jgi:ceramide glucosyltransferase
LFSAQRTDEPALPLLRELEREFGANRVTVAVEKVVVGKNGKVNNLAGALLHARHEVLVISDSDARLEPEFLAEVVAPLADPEVGAVTTFFRAVDADRWFERFELLGLNVDQFGMAMLAHATRLASFCFGVSTAFRAETLRAIGGFEGLGNYLVEDTEMGRRIRKLGKRVVVAEHVVDVSVDLPTFSDYVQKQIYWDRNTLAAAPGLFFGSLLLRIVPLALFVACLRRFDEAGTGLLLGALTLRWLSAAAILGVALDDRLGMRSLWLLPLKDLLGVVWSCRALLSRKLTWRGVSLSLDADGQLQERP